MVFGNLVFQTVPCDADYRCDENAACKWLESDMQHRCICNEGYTGDGYECLLESCQIVGYETFSKLTGLIRIIRVFRTEKQLPLRSNLHL